MENNTQTSLDEINNTIKTALSDSGAKVKGLVVEGMVNVEVNRRVDLLTRLVIAINTFSKEEKKIRPDLITYDGDGKIAREEWSKPKVEEKKKFTEKLAKANKTLENALSNNDYSNIENVIKEISVSKPDNKQEGTKTEPAP